MHTSYYASKKLDYAGMNLVGISHSVPKYLKNTIKIYRPLCPPWELVSLYKEGKITETRFRQDYRDGVLNRLDPDWVYQVLGDDAVLLCREAPDKFCHRHIVAEWLRNALNINVTEL